MFRSTQQAVHEGKLADLPANPGNLAIGNELIVIQKRHVRNELALDMTPKTTGRHRRPKVTLQRKQ